MSLFAVTIEQIGEIYPHANADRLDMARLQGKDYEFVVLRGQFHQGDKVVYFPVDSLLPHWITETLGLTGKLTGSEKNRVKTIRLRGNISQGVVVLPSALAQQCPEILNAEIGADITAMLGVEKYEPPAISSLYGNLLPLPAMVIKYDLESAQNFVPVVQSLMDEQVLISEKLEGSHWCMAWYADGDKTVVSQRNYRIEATEQGEHDWHKVARLGNYGEKLRAIAAAYPEPCHTLVIRGEILGPGLQGNYYKLKDHALYLFEIEVNGYPVNADTFLELCQTYEIPVVPVLGNNVRLSGWLAEKSIKEASDGLSALASLPREGIVIRPMQERRTEGIGRVIIKQRSPDYLAKSEF